MGDDEMMLTPTTGVVRLAYAQERHPAEFDRWLAGVKADALRDAAEGLKYPTEGASYEMWASDVGSWLRARADAVATAPDVPTGQET